MGSHPTFEKVDYTKITSNVNSKNIIRWVAHLLFFVLCISLGYPPLGGWMFMLLSWPVRDAILFPLYCSLISLVGVLDISFLPL